jgi:hypothetical protein
MQTPGDDDNDPLIGYRPMTEFAASEGFPVARATLNKRCSPAISTGPALIGYFGTRPATTKGLMRTWLRAQLRARPPLSKRLKAFADASSQPERDRT